MKKKIFFLIFFFYLGNLQATVKEEIISNFKKTNNLTFNFKQTINDKVEEGSCTIEYPKKIFCLYNNLHKKIIVSNGKSLVIKNQLNNQYYSYPLKRTPLNLILDKDFLIRKMLNSDGRLIDDKYFNFTLKQDNNTINIFFDSKTLNLIGWQTEDIYQNLVITFITSVKLNQKIKQDIFKLPKFD